MKITKNKLRNLIIEALKEEILEGFPGEEAALDSPARMAQDDIVGQLSGGIQGAIFDVLEEMGADEPIVELLSRVGEMSPEAEAVNAAILSAVRKGSEDYGRKLGLMGGPKPVEPVADVAEASVHREYDPATGRPIGGVTDDAGKVPWSRQAAEDAERAKKRAAMAADARAALKADRLKKR